MKKTLSLTILLASFLLFTGFNLQTEPVKHWKRLQQRVLHPANNQILYQFARATEPLTGLRFKVSHYDVRITSVDVAFADGSNQSYYLNRRITNPGQSRPLLIDDGPKRVSSVRFEYETVRPLEIPVKEYRPIVSVWGMN